MGKKTLEGAGLHAPGGPQRGPGGGSGTAGAVGMKHGRAMLCGPSWRGEQERPLPVLPLLRECAALHVTPRLVASESATCGTIAWDDDLSLFWTPKFFRACVTETRCVLLVGVVRRTDLSFSLSQRETHSSTVYSLSRSVR